MNQPSNQEEPHSQDTTDPESENIPQSMGSVEWALIVLLSILWGGSYFFIGVAVKELPPLTIVLSRVALAALILLVITYARGHRMPSSWRIWGAFLIMGALNNVIPFCLIVWGQTHIDSGLASILNAATPIFSVLLAHFLTRREKLTGNRLVGVLIGWVGVASLIGFGSLEGIGVEVIGQLAIVGAALAYALAAIFGLRFKGLNPLVVATGMLCASTIMMTPLALYFDQPWNLSPDAITLLALFGLATISTAGAYIIYFKVLASAGPTNILLVTFLIPISAILLGSVVLGERIGWNAFISMGLISAGLIIIDGRLLIRFRRQQRLD